ncbi:hypothetical protein [Pontibacter sp. SGAir0037]|uniref:hypothetical protein n=1 Tax=Pontibacter sp. SGAir0037 TaxID=2571030 RepID=UPI0010CCBA59|nr:hypothetical protein [Pontibacter sp. SGAir0037]QCR22261.1 hypothetical protein C1N53_07860 [Pontibacter sp. SGAir0037]
MRNKQTITALYDNILPVLAKHLHQNLAEIVPLFHDFSLERVLDTWTRGTDLGATEQISIENGNIQLLGVRLKLEGFQRAGIAAFDLEKELLFKLHPYSYEVGPDKNKVWLEKTYEQPWDNLEYQSVSRQWCDELIETLTQKLESLT